MKLETIKNRVERELAAFVNDIDSWYSLGSVSPFLFEQIKDFILRKGKRIRPILFVVGYMGYAKKPARNLYKSALSFELLHDFMLIHDDIIDKSETRRGKPSMHTKLNKYLKSRDNIRFSGQDLAIVIGDVLHALAMQAFLTIEEDALRKEKALQKFLETSILTGTGEFNELMYGITDIEKLSKEDIYEVYDLKSAYYTFSLPLTTGALLAGAPQQQTDQLFTYGLYLGRSFQILDDIQEMCENGNGSGQALPEDLTEAKKTILLWYAYHKSKTDDKQAIKNILSKGKTSPADVKELQRIIFTSQALDYARHDIATFMSEAKKSLEATAMKSTCKNLLNDCAQQIIALSIKSSPHAAYAVSASA